jgi:hypothetical protein
VILPYVCVILPHACTTLLLTVSGLASCFAMRSPLNPATITGNLKAYFAGGCQRQQPRLVYTNSLKAFTFVANITRVSLKYNLLTWVVHTHTHKHTRTHTCVSDSLVLCLSSAIAHFRRQVQMMRNTICLHYAQDGEGGHKLRGCKGH